MKSALKKLFIILTILSSIFIFKTQVNAQEECNILWDVTPEKGPSDMIFIVHGLFHCPSEPEWATIEIYYPSGEVDHYDIQLEYQVPGGSEFFYPIQNLPEVGVYKLEFYYNGNIVPSPLQPTFEVTRLVAVTCGSIVEPDSEACPCECTAVQSLSNNLWYCKGDNVCPPPDDGGGVGKNLKCKDQEALNTAIGCIPIDTEANLIGFFLVWSFSIIGGVGIFLIIYSAFLIITSVGNPRKVIAGKELLFSAVGGILMAIFSVYLLRFIGVDILKLIK